jgi:acyl-CoA hydrolase
MVIGASVYPPTFWRRVEARVLEFVFPTDTNHLGTTFRGTLVTWMERRTAELS